MKITGWIHLFIFVVFLQMNLTHTFTKNWQKMTQTQTNILYEDGKDWYSLALVQQSHVLLTLAAAEHDFVLEGRQAGRLYGKQADTNIPG